MRLYLGLMCADIFELDRIRQRLNTVRKYNNYSLMTPGADPGRGESGSSHGQIFSTLEYFALTFLKILD